MKVKRKTNKLFNVVKQGAIALPTILSKCHHLIIFYHGLRITLSSFLQVSQYERRIKQLEDDLRHSEEDRRKSMDEVCTFICP